METQKIWVENFNILEYNGTIGLELPIGGEPMQSASFLYDGRNCAILLKNQTKAYILTNIATDLRAKILTAAPLVVIETSDEKYYQGYPVEVTKTTIPYPDNLPQVVEEALQKIADKYGVKSLDSMVKKLWPDEDNK